MQRFCTFVPFSTSHFIYLKWYLCFTVPCRSPMSELRKSITAFPTIIPFSIVFPGMSPMTPNSDLNSDTSATPSAINWI